MEVALSPELEELITSQVASGRYSSPGEVVRDALRLFQEQLELRERRLEALRRDIQAGLDDLERGDFDEYDGEEMKSLADEIKSRGRERLAARGAFPGE